MIYVAYIHHFWRVCITFGALSTHTHALFLSLYVCIHILAHIHTLSLYLGGCVSLLAGVYHFWRMCITFGALRTHTHALSVSLLSVCSYVSGHTSTRSLSLSLSLSLSWCAHTHECLCTQIFMSTFLYVSFCALSTRTHPFSLSISLFWCPHTYFWCINTRSLYPMWHMTHSYAWHDSLICDVTHLYASWLTPARLRLWRIFSSSLTVYSMWVLQSRVLQSHLFSLTVYPMCD